VKQVDMTFVETITGHAQAATLFVKDSGRENILA